MINKPINFRVTCKEEDEDIHRVHEYYRRLRSGKWVEKTLLMYQICDSDVVRSWTKRGKK